LGKKLKLCVLSLICIFLLNSKEAYKETKKEQRTKISRKDFYKSIILEEYPNASKIIEFIFDHQSNDIPIEYVLSIVRIESHFNIYARNYNENGSIDYGLMQLNSNYFGKIYDPERNLKIGLDHLKWCFDVSNWDYEKALGIYNYGYSRAMNDIYDKDYTSIIMEYAVNLRYSYEQYLKKE
jgi:soluble lytic murein transglycosylase-like protein